jgi:hypothetical protein
MAQYDDAFLKAARSRAAEIDADLAQIEAGLVRANSDGDEYAMREMISGRATLRAERRALEFDYNERVAQATQPQRKPYTNKELLDMPYDRNLQDRETHIATINYMTGQSKYFNPEKDWADPEVRRRIAEGEAKHAELRKSKEYWG